MIEPLYEDERTWPRTLAIGFATALVGAIATKAGEWAVETLRKRVEKSEDAK